MTESNFHDVLTYDRIQRQRKMLAILDEEIPLSDRAILLINSCKELHRITTTLCNHPVFEVEKLISDLGVLRRYINEVTEQNSSPSRKCSVVLH